MDRQELTVDRIGRLKRQAANAASGLFLFDTKIPELGLRASPKGKRAQKVSWIVRRYLNGEREQVTIGHYPTMSIVDAREEARARLLDTARPLASHDKERAQKFKTEKDAERLGATIDKYIKLKGQPNSRHWHEREQTLRRELEKPLGKDTAIKDITSKQLRQLVEGKSHGAARNLYAAARPFLKWCILQEIIDASPLVKVEAPRPLKRSRALTDDEIKALWFATEPQEIEPNSWGGTPLDNQLFNPFHRLLLLTAQRREEVGGMRWSELDLKKATWTIPAERTKNRKQHLVHLSPQAVAVLKSIERTKGCDYVFSTTGETSISGYTKAKRRLDKRMAAELAKNKKPLAPWRVHDLRRTARTNFAKLRVPQEIAEKVLNHVPKDELVAIYNHYEYIEERKAALHAWGNYIEHLVSDKQPATNVLQYVRPA